MFLIVFARHESTVHELYLQLRSDLLADRFSCSAEQALHLGALALRVECVDGRRLDAVSVEHYIVPSVIRGRGGTSLYNSLMCELDDIVELSQDLAKLQFIEVCFD